jgi:LacI family transcriptional regulator
MEKHFNVLILASPVPTARFSGIARFARENGWFLTIEDRHCPPADWEGDGVLVMLSSENEALAEAVQRYRRRKIPVVDMKLARPDISLPRVTGDSAAMGRLAAEHFSERAFTNLAWYSSKWSPVQEERFGAFVENSKRATPDKWVWSDTGKATGGLGDGRLRWLEGKLKKAAKPLGVFCYSDYDATCVLNACLAAGLSVPEDVAILGVDDNEIICENQPVPLSSIRHDHGRVGYEAAALLQRLMKGGKAPSKPQLIAPVGITTRRSTDIIAAKDPILRDALAFIAENFMRPMSASKIAKAVGTSRIRLDKAFAAELGRSPGAEVMRRRLAKARYLLTDTDTKVIAIASQTGFCNAPYLIRSFKKVFGASPSVWRRREAATRKGRAGF